MPDFVCIILPWVRKGNRFMIARISPSLTEGMIEELQKDNIAYAGHGDALV
jgi:hypothetical protein